MDIAELSQLLETMDSLPPSQEEFDAAADLSKNTTVKLADEQKLQLYGLFKQSTIGNNTTSKPWAVEFVACAKWNAWKSYEGFPKESAMRAYVYIVTQLCTGGESTDLANSIGSNRAQGDTVFDGMGVAVSTLKSADEANAVFWNETQSIFQAVVDGDIEKLQKYIDSGNDLNSLDENGMTPLHFASDRGSVDIINLLLDNGAKLDSVNDEGQTSLMYAIICEHIEIVKLLLEKNANLKIIAKDGSTAISLGKESIEEIALLFDNIEL